MIKLKKSRDIIIIIIAVTVIVVFADRIIPLSAVKDVYADQLTRAGRAAADPVISSTGYGSPPSIRLDMVIDDRLFAPAKEIFAAAAPLDKEAENKGPAGGGQDAEALEPEGSSEEDKEVTLERKGIDYSNCQDFRIEVDLAQQRLVVFYKDDILREMVCSGGAPESPTPVGEFVTTQKIEYAWVEKFGVGAYYWIRFFEDYLIHSVPFDADGDMILEEFEKLGNPASHGCIRLRLEEAKWLYEALPLGVKVVIY